jgi:hypothetical protein
VTEGYADSGSLAAHLGGADFGAFGAAVDVTAIEVHGKVDPQVLASVEAWGPLTVLPWV